MLYTFHDAVFFTDYGVYQYLADCHFLENHFGGLSDPLFHSDRYVHLVTDRRPETGQADDHTAAPFFAFGVYYFLRTVSGVKSIYVYLLGRFGR